MMLLYLFYQRIHNLDVAKTKVQFAAETIIIFLHGMRDQTFQKIKNL